MTHALLPAFADPVFDSQAVFMQSLHAMSYVGRRQQLSIALTCPVGIQPAMAALALTLLDFETPFYSLGLSEKALAWLRFHTQAPEAAQLAEAHFVLVAANHFLPPMHSCRQGSEIYPDQGATLLVELPSLDQGPGLQVTGPGIAEPITLNLAGLPDDFVQQRSRNYLQFPAGVDLFVTCGQAFIGLPRSTKVEDLACMSQ